MARGTTLLERQLVAALQPFADFADPRGIAPPSLVITAGSGIAKRQLTMADCYAARDALANIPGARS